MKKIKTILYLLIASSFLLTSCKDALDITQDGEITGEVAVQNTDDLRGFLVGNVYGSLDTSSEIQLGSVFTDECAIAYGNSGWYFTEFRNILTSDNDYVSSAWLSNYRVINRVNRLLELANNFTPSASEVDAYNNVLAEARAVRAFAYLELESYFTTDMSDDSALGVILLDGIPEIDAQLPRATNGEIFAQIEADLNFAEANLSTNTAVNPNAGNYYYVTPVLIDAIRARMYAYRGKYTQAKTYAQNVINNFSNPLSVGTIYTNMWSDGTQGEVIWALSRVSLQGQSGIAGFWTTNTTDINGAPFLTMGWNLYNGISSGSDIRGFAFVDSSSTTTEKIINKYPGKGVTPLRNDIKVFRLSEMYFIMAEAEADAQNYVPAANYVYSVMQARNSPSALPVYTSKAEAFQGILAERRLELCYEGHRYVDLRRLGPTYGVNNNRNAMDDTANLSVPLSLSSSDYRFTFPIPSAERDANPNATQNPGY